MNPNSKVWIYQANRVLTNEEVSLIQPKAEAFVKQWASHGDQVFGKSEVKYNRFNTEEKYLINAFCFSIVRCFQMLKNN